MAERMNRRRRIAFLVTACSAFLVLCCLIAQPFLQPILAAAILAVLFHPLFVQLRSLTGNRNWAATLLLGCLLLTFAGILTLLIIALQGELAGAYRWLKTSTPQEGWHTAFTSWLEKATSLIGVKLGISEESLRNAISSRLQEVSGFLVKKTADLVGGVGSGVVSLVILFFTLFFLLRSGRRIVMFVAKILPLENDEIAMLLKNIDDSIRANVLGVLAVAAAQALLLGLALWVLGVPAPALWSLVTAICSIIPVGGAALVWAPAALYLIVTGSVMKGVILLAWGGGVVSLSDNFIRPWVISGRMNLSPAILFFALLGGVNLFGVIGIFLGPVIVSIAITLVSMLLHELGEQGEVVPASHESASGLDLPESTEPISKSRRI
jgi:predicted PurR-regulated permease PerM